ncbi:conserved hypothetical protein [Burkholderiales bacterium 8X]|nr:conserved hypothetical protein [Burkholderiales bacterium 8X]
MNDPIISFIEAIESAGMTAPGEIIADGRIHRFSPSGKKRDDAAWYVVHLDGIPAGSFGNWRTSESQTWCAKSDRDLTHFERQAIRDRIREAQRQREIETLKRNCLAAERANTLWAASVPTAGHPYLTRKRVKAYGLRVGKWSKWDHETGEITTLENVLLVPMRDTSGDLLNLQGIDESGVKRFLPGGRVTGLYHSMGRPSGRLLICEGLATAATIAEATGDAVACAFNAGNLEPVARGLRAKFADMQITICADDDHLTTNPRTGEPSNTGLIAARAAAAAVGGLLAVPDFTGLERGPGHNDFNDLACLAGAVNVEVSA